MESMEKVIAGLSNMIGDAEEKAKEQFNTLNPDHLPRCTT